MLESSARIAVSASEGRIEIEGPEPFVERQIDQFKSFIESVLGASAATRELIGVDTTTTEGHPAGNNKEALAIYDHVFAVADNSIQILKTLPGNGDASKTVSAALLLAFANELNGQESTTFEDIRALCKAHACLNSPNFSRAIKGEKEAFIVGGTKYKQTVRLTVPGRKRARELATSLNT